jgi:hypothetical protein
MLLTRNATLASIATIASLCVIGINGLVASPADASLTRGGKSVLVDASEGWQATGISVKQGQSIRIDYEQGKWRGSNDGRYIRPQDAPRLSEPTASCFPASETVVGSGSMIAKIGSGTAMNALSGPIQGTGMLYLRMNDCDEWLGDNGGNVQVRVY